VGTAVTTLGWTEISLETQERICCSAGYAGRDCGDRVAQRACILVFGVVTTEHAGDVNQAAMLVDVRDRVDQRALPRRKQCDGEQDSQRAPQDHGITW
jgi:hypothetical protein